MKPPLLTIPQVRARLSVGLSKVYHLVESGKLPAAKIDGQWRVDEVDLEAYIATRKAAAQPVRSVEGAIVAAFDADDLLPPVSQRRFS